MSHKCIRLLIEDTVKSLSDDIEFYYAKDSEFNQIRNPNSFCAVLDLLRATPQYATDGTLNYMKTWICSMTFYKIDKKGSIPEEYVPILDTTDEYVDKFINRLNFYSNQADTILITGINQEAITKATAHVLTGQLLFFNIIAQDNFDYCSVSDEC